MKWFLLSVVLLWGSNRGSADQECIEPGDRVLSRWKNGYYYKGTVETITNRVNVLYDTGVRFFYNERTTQDILPDAIPNNEEIPYGPAIVAQRPRSRAFELGYVKGINWTLGKYAVLHEGGDTIYHTRDELRVFNKTHVCDEPAYLGCYRDHIPRDVPLYVPTYPSTVATCVNTCKSRGFSIAGIRNSDLCFCGNRYDRRNQIGEVTCDEKCYNNPYEMCGGTSSYSTYWTGIVAGRNLNFVGGVMRHHVVKLPPQERLSYYKAVQRQYIARHSQYQRPAAAYKSRRVWSRYGSPVASKYATNVGFQRQMNSARPKPYSRYTGYTGGTHSQGYPAYSRTYSSRLPVSRHGASPPGGTALPSQRSDAKPDLDINPSVVGDLMAKIPFPALVLEELADLISLVDWKQSPHLVGMLKNLPRVKGNFRFLGCYLDNYQDPDMRVSTTTRKPLTIKYCALKCRLRGYSVAGVQASRCSCDQVYGRYGRLRNERCQIPCAGNRSEICGGYSANSLYYTGKGDAVPYEAIKEAARKIKQSKALTKKIHSVSSKKHSSIKSYTKTDNRKKDQHSSNKTKGTKSKFSVKDKVKQHFKGKHRSSASKENLSKLDLEKVISSLVPTLQLRLKVVREDDSPTKSSSNDHIKSKKNKVRLLASSQLGNHKYRPQSRNHTTNVSRNLHKASVPVVEADHHKISSMAILGKSKTSHRKIQDLKGTNVSKKNDLNKDRSKTKIRKKKLKKVFITKLDISVKLNKNERNITKPLKQNIKENFHSRIAKANIAKINQSRTRAHKGKGDDTKINTKQNVQNLTEPEDTTNDMSIKKNKNGRNITIALKKNISESFDSGLAQVNIARINQSRTPGLKEKEDDEKNITKQGVQNSTKPEITTDDVVVDIVKKTVVPTPPGFGVHSARSVGSRNLDAKQLLKAQFSLKEGTSKHLQPKALTRGNISGLIGKQKAVSSNSLKGKLEQKTSKLGGKLSIAVDKRFKNVHAINRNSKLNNKSEVSSLRKTFNKKSAAVPMEITNKLKRKHSTKKVDVEAIRVSFEEENDEEESGEDETEGEDELTKSNEENLSDNGSINEIVNNSNHLRKDWND